MLELETIRKDGSNGWMWVQGEADVDSTGKTIEIWGAAQDITERKRAEIALAESEALLDATNFMAHVGGWQLDVKTKALTWTKETYNIHEVSLDYKPSLDRGIQFYHPDDRDTLSQAIQRSLDQGKPFDMELRFITAKGNSRWTRAICQPKVVNGKTVKLSGTFQDITERKKLEIDLITKTEFLENVTENMFDLVSLTDMEGNFLFVGKSHKILGYDPDALRGKNVFELVHPEDSSYIMNEFGKFLQDKMNRTVEYKCLCADGTYLWVETLGKLLTDGEGNPERIIFSTRDITERRQKEDILHKTLKEKECLMKELNHRVKNNLAMVSSLICLKDSEITEDLSDLKNRVDVIKLVHEKLNKQNDVEEIEVREYFQELLTAVFSSTTKFKVDVVNTIEELSIPTGAAIPLGLVVNEIATNAIKHGFSSERESHFSIDMKYDVEERQYVLTLSNNGNPFPEGVVLNNPQTMGLQLVSSLVEQVGGSIELQKQPNPKFTIRIPNVENS
jgi:PAS domain S-box-containing protein